MIQFGYLSMFFPLIRAFKKHTHTHFRTYLWTINKGFFFVLFLVEEQIMNSVIEVRMAIIRRVHTLGNQSNDYAMSPA